MFFYAGCVYTAASMTVAQDAGLAAAERRKQAEEYAARGVALLEHAQKAGYFKDPAARTRLQKSPDLDALRSREDFRKLMMNVEKTKSHRP